jgi:hypothetical protein
MDKPKADAFAKALTELCRAHDVMLWALVPAQPMMLSDAPDVLPNFHYEAHSFNGDYTMIIERVFDIDDTPA